MSQSVSQSVSQSASSNKGSAAPLLLQEKGSASSTTYATLTDGKINIGGQAMDSAAGLGAHTDLESANQAIGGVPDLKALASDQKAIAAAAGSVLQVAAPLAAGLVGDLGKAREDAAAREADGYKKLAGEAAARGDAEAADGYLAKAGAARTTADNWGDDGVNRVGLHVATQAALRALAGGGAGALGAGAGVVGGNLGQRAGQTLGEAEADRLKLTGADRTELVNSYQQTGATLGGALAGAAGGGSGGAGALSGGLQGSAAATTVDVYNRQLHPSETQRIHELANGDAQKEARLTAAACALVRCADGVPQDDQSYAYLKGLQDAGEGMTAEKNLLDSQRGWDGRIYGPLFQYTIGQTFQDSLSQNRVGVRLEGALQSGLSVAGLAGDGLACSTTGVGCALATMTATVLADNLVTGIRKSVSGQPTVTYGEQVLQSLGLTPQAAAATYAITGVTPIVLEGMIASKAVNATEKYNQLAKASYSDFTTQGIKITADIMATPQVQALAKEIQAANPNLSVFEVERRAAGWVASGSNLPVPAIAAPGSVLLKAVPKGDGVSTYSPFWMSPEQARSIATMTPEQAGQALGLPAAQAAKMLEGGIDYYAISPISGVSPKVFLSNVAPTTQGVATTMPNAQQVIVPNRSFWTVAKPVNPFTLR